jgi:hypothetical protein
LCEGKNAWKVFWFWKRDRGEAGAVSSFIYTRGVPT